MKTFLKNHQLLTGLLAILLSNAAYSQNLEGYKYNGSVNPAENAVITNFQFNGYTNYWHDISRDWITYGNLFKMAVPKVDFTIAQSKMDIADDMNIQGLSLQEGFINELFTGQYIMLEEPSLQKLNESAASSNVLALVDTESEAGKMLTGKLPKEDLWKEKLKSHHY
jgi:hypothetical protein